MKHESIKVYLFTISIAPTTTNAMTFLNIIPVWILDIQPPPS
jgi:hypothetical protein